MDHTLKKIIAIVASVLVLVVLWYGTYLPMHKSQAFIATLGSLNSIKSIQDFETAFSVPLDIPSPIGQEELIRNLTNVVMGFVAQNQNPQATQALMDYIMSYYQPIVSRGKGMSFEQDLYILGALNQSAFSATKDPKYLAAAEQYFTQGYQLGPKRPQFLYSLMQLYMLEIRPADVKRVGDQILSQWPNDLATKTSLDQFFAAQQTAKPAVKQPKAR